MMRIIIQIIRFILLGAVLYLLYKVIKGEPLSFTSLFKRKRKPQDAKKLEEMKKDPVCGTYLPESQALTYKYDGQTYYFCSPECKQKFQQLRK